MLIRKFFLALLCALCFCVPALRATMLKNAYLVPCPSCGHEKPLLCLLSGNTIGSVLWSDGKQECPMLPQLSWVQRCPACKAYFLLRRLPDEGEPEEPDWKHADKPSSDTGELDYASLADAFVRLGENGFSRKEEKFFRSMLWRAYNDEAWRRGSEEDKHAFRKKYGAAAEKNLLALRRLLPRSGGFIEVLRAEILRELGEFEEAKEALDDLRESDEFAPVKRIIEAMRSRAEAKDASVFRLRP